MASHERSSRIARLAGAFAAALALAAAASAQSTQRVSVSSNGDEATGGSSWWPCVSADGRWITFPSTATNLVAGDTNGSMDVFLHDRQSGVTKRVSVSSSGAQGSGGSDYPSISADGRYVAFHSNAANLVANDTNSCTDVFVYDRLTGTTTRVSVDSAGAQADYDSSYPSLSADGRCVAFSSNATNLVAGDTNHVTDVFVRDLQTGVTTRVDVDSNGQQANLPPGDISASRFSADGRYVVFDSSASNLAPNDTNGAYDVFLHDRQTGTTTRVSRGLGGSESNGFSFFPSISADGRWIAFDSSATNLVAGDTNGVKDIFVYDVSTATTERVSLSSAGAQADRDCYLAWISADAGSLVFQSEATTLVAPSSSKQKILVHRRATGQTMLASVNSQGVEANNYSGGDVATISADGNVVVFPSYATNLVPRDGNGEYDTFVRDFSGCTPTIASYGTAGTSSQGCTPTLGASGTPSPSAGSGFTVIASEVDGETNGLLLYGIGGSAAIPWGGGSSVVCVKPPLQRTAVQSSAGTQGACDGSLVLDWNEYVATHPSALGSPFVGGETVWIQAWFRDPQAPAGSNLSDALWFQVCP